MIEAEKKMHRTEYRNWRELEKTYQALGRHRPGSTLVLSFDDTVALGLPRLTNRPVKGVPSDRLKFVPSGLVDHSSGEHFYVYMLKDKYPKGADRLLTVLYHWLRKIKWGTKVTRRATKLVLMADNFSENKNNVIFGFCSELVLRGWFREVEMLFGPVGHTHNGNDAYHYCHNQLVGNYEAVTLNEYVTYFNHAWHYDTTRPLPVVLETKYAWEKRYHGQLHRVSYYNETPNNPVPVRAFKLKKSRPDW
jgi:hypothetical protein